MSKYLHLVAQIIKKEDISSLPQPTLTTGPSGTVSNALKLVFGIAGAISLLIITIAALQYTLSQGNPQATAKAKNTIIYAVIGLTICVLAFSIVTFVITRL